MRHKCCFCECKDTKECGQEGEKFWHCPHFNEQICEICCIYDSLDQNWVECKTCEHDKDRDKWEENENIL